MATRCISPPLSWPTGSLARSARPTRSSSAATRARVGTAGLTGDPARQGHVLGHRQVGQQVEELEDLSHGLPAQQGALLFAEAAEVLPGQQDLTAAWAP